MKLKNSFLISIFVTAFIDMLGVGIIIPVIPAIFYNQDHVHFANLKNPDVIRWTFCLLIASYSFMMFFGAPILGALSDRFGRKKIIQFALIGTAIGYSLFGISLAYNSIVLIFLSRLIPGFFGGSLSVLFSSISDVSKPEDKPKNFALIGVAFALGFILGPFFGGILSSKEIYEGFTLSTPFIFATMLSIANFIFVHYKFEETLKASKASKVSLFTGFQNIKKAFSLPNLRILFVISFLNTLGFAFFTQFFSVYMYNKFHLKEVEVGYIFAWVGLWLIFTQGFLVRKITKRWSPQQIIQITMLLMGSFIFMLMFPNHIYFILLLNVCIAISQGLNSPNLLTLVSKQATPNQQGETLGINQSMQSLAQFIPPILVGFFGENLNVFPFLIGGLSIVLAWVILVFLLIPLMKKQSVF